MSSIPAPKIVRLVGVPMDLGAGRRGVDMGPSAIRIAGVAAGLRHLGFTVEDDGDVGVPAPETRDPGSPNARYLEPIYHVCNRLRLRVRRSVGRKQGGQQHSTGHGHGGGRNSTSRRVHPRPPDTRFRVRIVVAAFIIRYRSILCYLSGVLERATVRWHVRQRAPHAPDRHRGANVCNQICLC